MISGKKVDEFEGSRQELHLEYGQVLFNGEESWHRLASLCTGCTLIPSGPSCSHLLTITYSMM
ncbi:MAG: hypothetical protein HXS54_04650 [Theionarchaea archaeon]|nr:hypothetical protein [Theionarchaea archaeon]